MLQGLNAKPMIGPQELKSSLSQPYQTAAAPHIPTHVALPLTPHDTFTTFTFTNMSKGRVCLAYSGKLSLEIFSNVSNISTRHDSLHNKHSLT
jgi:hypothetical protein